MTDDAALPMRSFTATLLLLLLPALLVPAGFLLRVCACAEPRLEPTVRSCCAKPAEETASTRSCCSTERRAPRDGDAPTASALDCRCRLVPLADDAPTPLPSAPFVLVTPPQHPQPLFTITLPEPTRLAATTAESRPPPQRSQRNLPLRL